MEPPAADPGGVPEVVLPTVLLEVCCDSVASCVAAEGGGAGRVELCSGLVDGGLTPSAGMIYAAVAAVSIPVMVLIRPRSGDFVFTAVEVDVMLKDISVVGEQGAAGVVIGALDADGMPDMAALSQMVTAAKAANLECTFHR
jgi:copper homeostasis protein